ncbi:hypothetical protein [Moritella viscosa]|uniref:MORN variant repeat protein n=1 Tax=Moritella viscosa TaxID=80854 RepID=A0A1L0AI74_9GAMM|nr:hypothetical protein [Moritella viscosa]SGZ16541.1 MORN variant repeat protein [Moritella viscosa]
MTYTQPKIDKNQIEHYMNDEIEITTFHENGEIKATMMFEDGLLHNEYAPAVTKYTEDGTMHLQEWYNDGVLHRNDGYAVIHFDSDGDITDSEYFLCGEEVNEADICKAEMQEEHSDLLKKHVALDHTIQEYKHMVDYDPTDREGAKRRQHQVEKLELHQENYKTLTGMMVLLNLTPLKPTRFVSDEEQWLYGSDYEQWLLIYGDVALSKRYKQPLELL